jgi:hypothetical protein
MPLPTAEQLMGFAAIVTAVGAGGWFAGNRKKSTPSKSLGKLDKQLLGHLAKPCDDHGEVCGKLAEIPHIAEKLEIFSTNITTRMSSLESFMEARMNDVDKKITAFMSIMMDHQYAIGRLNALSKNPHPDHAQYLREKGEQVRKGVPA